MKLQDKELLQINPCADFETGLFSGNKPVIQVKNITQKRMNVNTKVIYNRNGKEITFSLQDKRGHLLIEKWHHRIYECCSNRTAHFEYDLNDTISPPTKQEMIGEQITFTIESRTAEELQEALKKTTYQRPNPHSSSGFDEYVFVVSDYTYFIYVCIGDKIQEIAKFRSINLNDVTTGEEQVSISNALLND